MATTSTLPGFCLARASSLGKDFLQGSHQVAQKSTIVILPATESSETLPFPFKDWIAKGGASLPTSPGPEPPMPGPCAGLAVPAQAETVAIMKEIPARPTARER